MAKFDSMEICQRGSSKTKAALRSSFFFFLALAAAPAGARRRRRPRMRLF
jgi:hypothetical protein